MALEGYSCKVIADILSEASQDETITVDSVISLMDKFNSVSLEYDDANSQFKRIVNTLYGLKKMISDYLLNSFDSRSYLENDIMFNRYLAVLNSVKNVSTELKNVYKDDISDS